MSEIRISKYENIDKRSPAPQRKFRNSSSAAQKLCGAGTRACRGGTPAAASPSALLLLAGVGANLGPNNLARTHVLHAPILLPSVVGVIRSHGVGFPQPS